MPPTRWRTYRVAQSPGEGVDGNFRCYLSPDVHQTLLADSGDESFDYVLLDATNHKRIRDNNNRPLLPIHEIPSVLYQVQVSSQVERNSVACSDLVTDNFCRVSARSMFYKTTTTASSLFTAAAGAV